MSKNSERVQSYSYNADEDSNNSYVDNAQNNSGDKDPLPAASEQSTDGYSYVDNSQLEEIAKSATSNANNSAAETPSGYSYVHEDSNSSESIYIDNNNYYVASKDNKPTKQAAHDDLKKPKPMANMSTPTPTPLPDMKNWTIDYFSLQNKYVQLTANNMKVTNLLAAGSTIK